MEGSGRFKFGLVKEEGLGSPSQYEGRGLNIGPEEEGVADSQAQDGADDRVATGEL